MSERDDWFRDEDDWEGFPETRGKMNGEVGARGKAAFLYLDAAPNRRYTKTKRLALIGAMAASAMGAVYWNAVNSRIHQPKIHVAITRNDSCPTPSAKSIGKVDKLFTEPVAEETATYKQHVLQNHGGFTESIIGTINQDFQARQIGAEAILGLSNDVLSRYGVTAGLVKRGTKPTDGLGAPSQYDLNHTYFEENATGILTAFAELPVKYVKEVGIKKIEFAAGNPKGTEWYVDYDGTLIWNMDSPNSDPQQVAADVGTAFGYPLQAKECRTDDIQNDPGLVLLNPVPLYVKEGSPTRGQSLYNYDHGLARAGQVNIVQYSSIEDAGSDKAAILGGFTDPELLLRMLSPSHPTLRAKTEYVLAQAYSWQPDLVIDLAHRADKISAPNGAAEPAGLRRD